MGCKNCGSMVLEVTGKCPRCGTQNESLLDALESIMQKHHDDFLHDPSELRWGNLKDFDIGDD